MNVNNIKYWHFYPENIQACQKQTSYLRCYARIHCGGLGGAAYELRRIACCLYVFLGENVPTAGTLYKGLRV